MASVYVATDLKHHRLVAIKVLREQLSAALDAQRFAREIEIAAALNHPHILPLFDSGAVKVNGVTRLYYVMPYIEGESLRERLTRDGALPVTQVTQLTREIADALAKAHAAGLVHRDIKPENILVSDNHALVMDFGIARAIHHVSHEGPLTLPGMVVGTPEYMAPEQAAGDPHVDARADIYALGAVAYEMLSGKPPFSGVTAQQVIAAQIATPPEPISVHRASTPRPLASLVMQCLEKNPADRPQSAADIISAIDAAGAAVVSPEPGMAGRIVDERAWRWAIIALMTIAVLGYAVWAWAGRGDDAALSPEAMRQQIAVLPFASDSADRSFSDGLTEEILVALSSLPGLTVRARAVSFQYRDRNPDLAAIGSALGVGSVLTGSLQPAGDSVRIRVQLLDTRTGSQLWGAHYDRRMTDLFAIEDEISRAVADTLRLKLAGPGRLVREATSNADAHRRHLQAATLLHRGDEQSLRQAVALDSEAVALDPAYAQAWASLADGLGSIADAYGAPSEIVPAARAAAMRAVALDDSLAAGHVALGAISLQWDWNFPLAKQELERGLELDPRSSRANFFLGIYRVAVEQDFAGSRAAMLRASELDPQDPWSLAFASMIAQGSDDPSAALSLANESLRIDPSFAYQVDPLAQAYQAAGRWRECADRFAYRPDSSLSLELGICRAGLGDSASARRIFANLQQEARTRYVPADIFAELSVALGMHDSAFVWLDRAARDRSANLMGLSWGRIWDPIRADPRFTALLRRIGFPWAAR